MQISRQEKAEYHDNSISNNVNYSSENKNAFRT